MTHKLVVNQLQFSYQQNQTIINDLSLTITTGHVLTILGPNGIGKSTLLNCICGLTQPQSGSISLDGTELTTLSTKERAQIIAYVPQQPGTVGSLTVEDYVATGRTPYLSIFQSPTLQDVEDVHRQLKALDIEQLQDHLVNQLSGGQLQMVTLARALMQSPKILILDEPTAALDYARQTQVLTLIDQLRSDHIVIMTTHDPNHALLLNDQVGLFMDHKLKTGTCQDLVTQTNMQKIYHTPLILTHVNALHRDVCGIIKNVPIENHV